MLEMLPLVLVVVSAVIFIVTIAISVGKIMFKPTIITSLGEGAQSKCQVLIVEQLDENSDRLEHLLGNSSDVLHMRMRFHIQNLYLKKITSMYQCKPFVEVTGMCA